MTPEQALNHYLVNEWPDKEAEATLRKVIKEHAEMRVLIIKQQKLIKLHRKYTSGLISGKLSFMQLVDLLKEIKTLQEELK